MVSRNPYNYNLPVSPDMFYGRNENVETLINQLTAVPGDSIALIGGRRMGKTSILEALMRHLDDLQIEPKTNLSPFPYFLISAVKVWNHHMISLIESLKKWSISCLM